MHLSCNVWNFVFWYHQLTFEHWDWSFVVEVLMTLFGELLVTPQRTIALLSEVGVSQQRWARFRGSQGRKVAVSQDKASGTR